MNDVLARFRADFPVVSNLAYFASGSVGPASVTVLNAIQTWQTEWAHDPQRAYRSFQDRRETLRQSIAEFIGAPPDDVAITENATRGSHAAVRVLANRPGNHVVVDTTTYPSSRYPWLAWTDKAVRHVDYGGQQPSAAVAAAVTPDTAAVSVSHVDWATGARHDIRALADAAHRRGAALIVDASQSVGAIPVDVIADDVDVLVGTFGKWLLGGPGLGYLYLRGGTEGDASAFEPGWKNLAGHSLEWPTESFPEYLPTARRFEPATPNLPGIVTATAGLRLLRATGQDVITSAIAERMAHLRGGLAELGVDLITPTHPDQYAGLTVFRHSGATQVAARLREHNIEITGYAYGLVRIDPHAFNVGEEIDLLLARLRETL